MLLALAQHLAAGIEKDGQLVIGSIIKIESKILAEERPLWIYLPDKYDDSEDKYPVFYLLDGKYNFHHATGIVQFLSSLSIIPKMIVVAVLNTDRNRDFLPTRVDDFPETAGADKFIEFFKDELIPYIDKTYRTVPYRILCGHSFGGLFIVYFMLNNPSLFNAYIAVSPSLYWDDRLVFKKAEQLFKNEPGLKSFLYFTLAGGDREGIQVSNRGFEEFLKTRAPKELLWHFRYLEKESHGSTVHRSVYYALEALYSGYRLRADEMEAMTLPLLRDHYKKLSQRLGCDVPVPAAAANLLGFTFMEHKKYEAAIEVFKYCVDTFPASPEHYYRLGLVYDSAGKTEQAESAYKTALELAEKTNHRGVPFLKRTLKELLEKKKNKKK
jgi:predicted alpha/beta superfamily hydrolase